jgi:zinc transporter ZupT
MFIILLIAIGIGLLYLAKRMVKGVSEEQVERSPEEKEKQKRQASLYLLLGIVMILCGVISIFT